MRILKEGAFALLAASALALAFAQIRRIQHSPNSFIEDVLQTGLREGTAFHVSDAMKFLGQVFGLLLRNRSHPLVLKTCEGVRIFTEIDLGTDQQFRYVGAVVPTRKKKINC